MAERSFKVDRWKPRFSLLECVAIGFGAGVVGVAAYVRPVATFFSLFTD